MTRSAASVVVLLLLLSLAAPSRAAPPELTAEDRAQLEAVFERCGLFDPGDARRVRATIVQRDCWGGERRAVVAGWAPAGDGRPEWVVLDDLSRARVVADAAVEDSDDDFAARMRAFVAPKEGPEARFGHFGPFGSPAVAFGWAAWAHRLGHDDVAAELLALARAEAPRRGGGDRDGPPPTLEDHVKAELVWGYFATAVHAFMQAADDEALEAARALARYDELSDRYGPGKALLRDLERRAAEDRLGERHELPADLAERPLEERIALLVLSLEDVDARQWSQPGGVALGGDARVAALIALGEPAVPALIDCLEEDDRLTRSVHFWRDFARSRTVLSVREAALTALQAILQVREFEAASTGDSLSARGPEAGVAAARRIRAYWEANKGLTLEERMRRTLLDRAASPDARRAAAWSLAGRDQAFGTMVFVDGATRRENARALALADPTAADAILAALDAELPTLGAGRAPDMAEYERGRAEGAYLGALAALGDARIVPTLRERFAAATRPSLLVQLALACDALGAPEPLDDLARRLAAGELFADARRSSGGDPPDGLTHLVQALARAGRPARAAALDALADPAHPLFELALEQVLRPWGFSEEVWAAHPMCLRLLGAALAREEPTGRTYSLQGSSLVWREAGGTTTTSPPEWLDLDDCLPEAAARVCDEAAARLGDLLVGVPRHHALLRDRDASLAAVRDAAARFAARARRPTPLEAAALGSSWDRPSFIPDVPPLDRAATAEDVAAGRALFHLGGEGVRADVRLPALAEVLRSDGRVPGLVVQADTGPDGERVYGVLAADGAGQVPAGSLAGLRPLPTDEEVAAAAEELVRLVLAEDLDGLGAYLDPGQGTRDELKQWVAGLREELASDPEGARAWARGALRPRVGAGWRLGP